MEYWTEYQGHEAQPHVFIDKRGKPHIDDLNIYTFDIETTSYFITKDGRVHKPLFYEPDNPEITTVGAFMYIWMLGINDRVYYGRTPDELTDFLTRINNCVSAKKFFYVHNLSFEFQFLKSFIDFTSVFARKRRKPMRAESNDYNIQWRCSYMLSNCSLDKLADNYDLPVHKKTGDLDYYRLRNSKTVMSETELGYCEYDCLVLYHYIKRELERYTDFRHIPLTSTGKVRNECRAFVSADPDYLTTVRKQFDTDPLVYNAMMDAYCGGYTHANTYMRGEILLHVKSFDFTSSYPYVLLTEKYPCSKFTESKMRRFSDMDEEHRAYLLYVRFTAIESLLDNPIIPVYKIKHASHVCNDNGRLESADYIEIWLTDLDFKMIMENYSFRDYEILKSYSAQKDYLPRPFLQFILELYKTKTIYKDVPEAADKYRIAKANLNSLYGMCVTNYVRPQVVYDSGEWLDPKPVDVRKALMKLAKTAFLNQSWGVWCTAYARYNIISIMRQLDSNWIYTDTDSGKLIEGTDERPIEEYNRTVYNKIKKVCAARDLCEEDFSPADIEGKRHTLGIFKFEHEYQKFKTMGSKKYAGVRNCKLEITIAGVAKKSGGEWLGKIENFGPLELPGEKTVPRPFPGIITGKSTSLYCDDQPPVTIVDYQANTEYIDVKSGLALMPCDYHLKYSDTDVLAQYAGEIRPDEPTEGRIYYNG